MADADRSPADPVAFYRALSEKPYRHDFFQALRRLECIHADRPRLGRSLRVADDPIRLSQAPSLAFAPAALKALIASRDGGKPRLEVRFLGLFGPNGPLPTHLTEYAYDRLHNHGDPTFARFADIFHHRMLSFFYRAWADARPTVSLDRADEDRFRLYLGALAGLGGEAHRDRDAWPDHAKLHHAGILSGQTRHAEGLRSLLQSYFRVPAEVQTFVGYWMELPLDAHNRLDGSPDRASLGTTLMLGTTVWDRQQKFQIVVGPLQLARYQQLLPGTPSHERLVSLVRNYVGFEWIWDVKLVLARTEVPACRLNGAIQLGWTSWLHGRGPTAHAGDLVITPADTVGAKQAAAR